MMRFVASAKVIAGLTLVSRVLGLMRDVLCGAVFGATGVWDAFVIAFQIPNLFRRLFGEGALSSAFIPVFSRRLHREGPESAKVAAQQVVGLQLVALLGLVLLGEAVIAGWWLLDAASPRDRLTLALAATMLPYVVLICGTALLGGMLNVLRVFSTPAAAPVLLNICIISAIGFAWETAGEGRSISIWPVAIAVLVAGVLQLAMQWAALLRRNMAILPVPGWSDPAVRTILKLLGPTAFGLAAVQINTLADTLIAYWLIGREGAPSHLYYAQRLYQFPLGVMGLAVATAIFEQLSAEAARGQIARLRETAAAGLRVMFFLGLPASVGLILVAKPLVATIFERGQFTPEATERVAGALAFYSLGVWAYMSQHVFVRGFYAMQRPQVPARIAAQMVGLNLALNLLLVGPLAERGLALATALTACVQLLLLRRAWVKAAGWPTGRRTAASVARTAVATAGMAAAVLAVQWLLHAWTAESISLIVQVAGGGAVFAALAYLLRSKELTVLTGRVRP